MPCLSAHLIPHVHSSYLIIVTSNLTLQYAAHSSLKIDRIEFRVLSYIYQNLIVEKNPEKIELGI